MLLAVHDRVMKHLESLENTQEARVDLGRASRNSYASFLFSKLPKCVMPLVTVRYNMKQFLSEL